MKKYKLICSDCKEVYTEDIYQCTKCGGTLHLEYDLSNKEELIKSLKEAESYWDYHNFFSLDLSSNIITMGEGTTPLVKASNLAKELGLKELYIKNEALNPTGTFKDRCMSISISKALELGASAIVIGSAGNAAASAAAYSSRAKLPCYVMVPSFTPPQRLALIMHYGANVIPMNGNVTDCIELISKVYKKYGWHNVTTASHYNPFQADSEKAIAYELAKQLEWDMPDYVITPIGGGGILSGVYNGFKELKELGLISKIPKMVGSQDAGCNHLSTAFKEKKSPENIERVKTSTAIAVAIADAFPLDGRTALQAIYDTNGYSDDATSDEILKAQAMIGRTEGILAETASSTTVAVLKKMIDKGIVKDTDKVVCVVSGNGMKELNTIEQNTNIPKGIECDADELDKYIKENF